MNEVTQRAQSLGIKHYYHARPTSGNINVNPTEWNYYRFLIGKPNDIGEILENDVWVPIPQLKQFVLEEKTYT